MQSVPYNLALCTGIAVLGWAAPATAAPPAKSSGTHLDLRLPELRSAIVSTAGRFTSHAGAFAAPENLDARIADRFAPAFAGLAGGRAGGAVEFAHRIHREGLPVARLWENRSALLSLGLNAKGKPGLWLVQKIR